MVVNSAARPLLVIIGPSACGKSTVVRRLAEQGLLRVHPTWTTRPPRADEDPTDETLEHRFVDEARFAELEHEGFFWGTTHMFGLPHRYGLPRLELQPDGPVDAVMLRAPLVEQLRAVVPWLLVYQIDADLEQAAARIVERSVDDGEARARTAANEVELEPGRGIANRVFTNDRSMEDLVGLVRAALLVDYGPGIRPEGRLGRRTRSVLEGIGIVIAVCAAVLVAGIVVMSLIFMYALSQWSSNK